MFLKGYDKKAADWRRKLAEYQASTQPASAPTRLNSAASQPASAKSQASRDDTSTHPAGFDTRLSAS